MALLLANLAQYFGFENILYIYLLSKGDYYQ